MGYTLVKRNSNHGISPAKLLTKLTLFKFLEEVNYTSWTATDSHRACARAFHAEVFSMICHVITCSALHCFMWRLYYICTNVLTIRNLRISSLRWTKKFQMTGSCTARWLSICQVLSRIYQLLEAM